MAVDAALARPPHCLRRRLGEWIGMFVAVVRGEPVSRRGLESLRRVFSPTELHRHWVSAVGPGASQRCGVTTGVGAHAVCGEEIAADGRSVFEM